jgi:hypothetical protein
MARKSITSKQPETALSNQLSGIESGCAVPDTLTGENLGPADRLSHLLEEIESADRVGVDVYGIGEHHRAEFLDSAPKTILAAAAVRTERRNRAYQIYLQRGSQPGDVQDWLKPRNYNSTSK